MAESDAPSTRVVCEGALIGSDVSKRPGRRFVALDAWRGIAALMVIAYHLPLTAAAPLGPLWQHGYLFVDFFFALSGFVLAWVYGESLRDRRNLGPFLWRRLARVYPLHLVTLLPFVVVVALGLMPDAFRAADHQWSDLGWSATLLYGLEDLGHGWNVPSWSISTEWWSYVLFALLVPLGRTRMAAVIAVVAAIVLVVRWEGLIAAANIERTALGFTLGVLARDVYRALVTRWSPAGATALEVAVVATTLVGVMALGGTWAECLLPVLFTCAVLVFAKGQGALSRALSGGVGKALGRLSFGAYLHHHFVVLVVTWAAIELGLVVGLTRPGQALPVAGGLPELLGLAAVVFPVTIGLAWLTERTIERPLYRWARARVGLHPVPRRADPTPPE